MIDDDRRDEISLLLCDDIQAYLEEHVDKKQILSVTKPEADGASIFNFDYQGNAEGTGYAEGIEGLGDLSLGDLAYIWDALNEGNYEFLS